MRSQNYVFLSIYTSTATWHLLESITFRSLILYDFMKTFDVPDFIEHPSGVFCLDVLPVLTLFPGCLTLNLFRKSRRYADLVGQLSTSLTFDFSQFIFTVGFLLALVYHWCQLNPRGLANSTVLSLDGTLWRTLDVLCCPVMLTRTGGHIFGTSNISLRSNHHLHLIPPQIIYS